MDELDGAPRVWEIQTQRTSRLDGETRTHLEKIQESCLGINSANRGLVSDRRRYAVARSGEDKKIR